MLVRLLASDSGEKSLVAPPKLVASLHWLLGASKKCYGVAYGTRVLRAARCQKNTLFQCP